MHEGCKDFDPKGGQNLALAVLYLPYSFEQWTARAQERSKILLSWSHSCVYLTILEPLLRILYHVQVMYGSCYAWLYHARRCISSARELKLGASQMYVGVDWRLICAGSLFLNV